MKNRFKTAALVLLCVMLTACHKGQEPADTAYQTAHLTETNQPTRPAEAKPEKMGLVGALHKVYKERNNVTTYVFAYEIADNAFLFAVDPPAPHTTWDFRPIGLYYYHGKSDSVHFLGEYPLISVRVLNGANLALLTTKATDIYQGGTPFLPYNILRLSGAER